MTEKQAPADGRRAKRFGWVPQTPALLPWRTVRDNLTLLPNLNRTEGRGPLTDHEIDDLLQAVDLAPFAGSLPAENGKYSLNCAVIVKRVDARTRAKVGLNELLRRAESE